jgi:hypothetical protein
MFLDTRINHTEKKVVYVFVREQKEAAYIACVYVCMVVKSFCCQFFIIFNILCFDFVQGNHQNTFSILEQALVLSGLTDYITCASQNELFHTFHKKADHRSLPTIFMCLSRKWVRFFHKLGPYGKLGSL